jgi:hypothetical protein
LKDLKDILAKPERIIAIIQEDLDEIDYMRAIHSDIKFGGKNQWPEFRLYEPGFAPQPFYRENVELFLRILKVANKFIVSLKDDKFEKEIMKFGQCYLLNVDKEGEYKSKKYDFDKIYTEFTNEIEFAVSYNEMDIRRLKKNCRKSGSTWEIGAFYSADLVMEEIEFYPILLIIVDRGSGMIIGQQVLKPFEVDIDIQQYLIEFFTELKEYPREIFLESNKTSVYLSDLFELLGIKIQFADELLFIPEIKRELLK